MMFVVIWTTVDDQNRATRDAIAISSIVLLAVMVGAAIVMTALERTHQKEEGGDDDP
jgi:hypothetical protein